MSFDHGGRNEIPPGELAPDILELVKKPGRVLCGDIDMRINHNAKWFYNGSAINRKKMVKLFSTVLHRDDFGRYWMITPAEMARIRVDDAPFTALELISTGSGEYLEVQFRTNVDTVVPLDEDHPLRVELDEQSGEPRPYVTVRNRLDALIVRSSFYQLIELGSEIVVDGEAVLGVWSFGTFFPIGTTEASA